MTNSMHNAREILNVAIEVAMILIYFSLLSKKKHKGFLPIILSYGISAAVLTAAVMLKVDAILLLLVSCCILLAIAVIVFEGAIRNKLLWTFIYVIIITVAEPLMIGFLRLADMGSPIDFLEVSEGRILGMIGTKIIYLWLICVVQRIIKNKVRDLPLKYWALILVIPITSIFMLQSLLVSITTENIKVNYISSAVEVIGLLYINIAMFNFFESYDNKIRLEYLEKFKEQEQENYKMLSFTYKQMREFKHDIENQFSVLHSLIEHHDMASAGKYLTDLTSFVKTSNVVCHSGNHAVDSLVNIKAAQAKTQGIQFICKINVVSPITADEMELCRIIGNALDNAIEGCVRADSIEKHICFTLQATEEYVIVTITNTSNNVDIRFLTTTKKKKELHGIGTQSMKSSVERLEGIMDMDYSNGLFTLIVMVHNGENLTK